MKNKEVKILLKNEVSIEIDLFTPCLEDNETGEIINTKYKRVEIITSNKALTMKKEGWNFDWSLPFKNGYEVYALIVENSYEVEGLVAIKNDPENTAVHIDIVESAPKNRGKNRVYLGVGGHLFAIAIQKSYNYGNEGYVYFKAKTDLIEHYVESFGARQITKDRIMVIEEDAAMRLIKIYNLREE